MTKAPYGRPPPRACDAAPFRFSGVSRAEDDWGECMIGGREQRVEGFADRPERRAAGKGHVHFVVAVWRVPVLAVGGAGQAQRMLPVNRSIAAVQTAIEAPQRRRAADGAP